MDYHSFFNIVRYEIRMLRRDWGMRLVALMFTVGIILVNLITHTELTHHQWEAVSTSSAIPFTNAWLLGHLLLFLAIFWAGRFMQQSADSDAAIQVRPFSNTEYVCGKASGFLAVAFSLTLLWTLIVAFIHLFLCDSPFEVFPYLFYLLTLTLPALVFFTGLAVWLKGAIRNAMLALLVISGFLLLLLVYGSGIFYGVADVFSSRLPNLFSDIIGFSMPDVYLWHRLVFLLWGCGLLLLGILRVKRLPNRPRLHCAGLGTGLFLLLLGCFAAGKYIGHFTRDAADRAEIRRVFAEYGDLPKARITANDLVFRQCGDSCEVTAKLTLYNPSVEVLPSVVLYLNPSLTVASVTIEGMPVEFKRELQAIVLEYSLQPRQSVAMEIHYQGTPVPAVCYAEIDSLQKVTELRNQYLYRPGRDFFYLTPQFTLLTPECLWYPVALPPVDVRSPWATVHSYTRFTLTVVGEKERVAISQGKRSIRGDSVCFVPDQQLPGISLCIGNYIRMAFNASASKEPLGTGYELIPVEELLSDSTLYEIYLFKGHEKMIDGFKEPLKLLDRWHWLLTPGEREYHYRKLALIETPLHFCAPSRFWKNGSEYIQPEMVFRPEWEAFSQIAFKIREPEPRNTDLHSEPPHLRYFTGYLNANYGEIRHQYTGFPLLYGRLNRMRLVKNECDLSSLLTPYSCSVSSSEFIGIDLLFQAMQLSANSALRSFHDGFGYEAAIEYLENHCLADAFSDGIGSALMLQTVYLVGSSLLRHILTTVSYKEWALFNREFLARHAFREVTYETYARELQDATGVDLLSLTRYYYHSRQLPVFSVGKPHFQRTEDSTGKAGFLMSLPLWNRGDSDGVVSIAGNYLRTNLHFLVPAGACREIRVLFPVEMPEMEVEVQTNLAQNIPAYYSFEGIIPDNTLTNSQPGMYEADKKQFLPPPGEYIVDDRDSGFQIVTIGSRLKKKTAEESGWIYNYDSRGHGDAVKGFFSKRNGEGNTRAEWNTYLNDSGDYELFIYNNGCRFRNDARLMWNNIPHHTPVQVYTFTHSEGEEKIPLEMQEDIDDWVSLGIYAFEAGPAKVSLSDVAVDVYHSVAADAVKWVYLGK